MTGSDRRYYVYILSSPSHVLYTGVTNDLNRRVAEHRHKLIPGFSRRYNVTRLVHFEETSDVRSAIAREKEIKAWRRSKKVALVDAANPGWKDLAASWHENEIPRRPTPCPAHRRNERNDIGDGMASAVIPNAVRNLATPCHSELSEESRSMSGTDEIPRRPTPRNDSRPCQHGVAP